MYFGMKITDRCTMSCNHCMYSATTKGYGMHDKIIEASYDLYMKLNEHHPVFGIWGGEPFLDIILFEKVYNKFKNDIPNFYVSTNGFWMNNDRIQEFVFHLMNDMSARNFGEPYGIKVSDTYWHRKARRPETQKGIELLRRMTKDPDMFASCYHNWDGPNPFLFTNSYYPEIYIDNSNEDKCAYNPVGRAIENSCCDVTKKCPCVLTDIDDPDLWNLEIQPNGDIQICCSADSAVVGNVLDSDITFTLIKARVYAIKHMLRVNEKSMMINTCEQCKSCKVVNHGYHTM